MWCTALWCRHFRIHRYVAAPIFFLQEMWSWCPICRWAGLARPAQLSTTHSGLWEAQRAGPHPCTPSKASTSGAPLWDKWLIERSHLKQDFCESKKWHKLCKIWKQRDFLCTWQIFAHVINQRVMNDLKKAPLSRSRMIWFDVKGDRNWADYSESAHIRSHQCLSF